MGINAGLYWWDWLPEVVMDRHMYVSMPHGHLRFFLLYKRNPMVIACQMEVDDRFPIIWDMLSDVEGELA